MRNINKNLFIALITTLLASCGGGGSGGNGLVDQSNLININGVAFYSNNLVKNTDIVVKCGNGIIYNSKTNDFGYYSVSISKNAPPCGIKLSTNFNGSSLNLFSAIPLDYQQLDFISYNLNYLTNIATTVATSSKQSEWFDASDFKNLTKNNLIQSFITIDDRLKLSGILANSNGFNMNPLNQKINDGEKYYTPQGAEIQTIESCIVHNVSNPTALVQAVSENKNVENYFKTDDFYENWAKYTEYSSSMYAKKVYVSIVAAFVFDKRLGTINDDNAYVKVGRRLYYGTSSIDYPYLKYAAEIEKTRSGVFNGWVTGISISPEATLFQADANGNMIIVNRQAVPLDHYKFKGDYVYGPSNCLLK